MARPLVYATPHSRAAGEHLARSLGAEFGRLAVRRFPDGESYVRLHTPPKDRDVIVVASLDDPDDKLIPLILLLSTARELGARQVGLVAPYLCYMRQDRRFHEGEAVSVRVMHALIGRYIDWIATVDPHLHRIHNLAEVYRVPAKVVHAAPAVAGWIASNVDKPLLIGPDEESEQWVSEVAQWADAPWVVLDKVRHDARNVEVSVPETEKHQGRRPVLVDDIISTGRTMIETTYHLRAAGMLPPICIGVHGLFAGEAILDLYHAGVEEVVTCDTVPHPSNRIAVAELLAEAVRELTA